MSDKELIRQEIERRIKNLEFSLKNNCVEKYSKLDILGNITTLESLLQFINSLPEEPESEDLEEAMEMSVSEEPLLEFFATGQPTIGAYGEDSLRNQFEAGAKWQKQQMKEALQTEYEKGRFDMREEMMKALVNGEIVKDIHNQLSVKSEPLNDTFGKFGDKVKIIICKTEQQ